MREQVAVWALRQLVARPSLAGMVLRRDPWGNIFEPARYADPYPILDRMRSSGAVSYSPAYRQWAVCGYEAAREVFASDAFVVAPQLTMLLSVRPHSKTSEHTQRVLRAVMLLSDPPKHTRLRVLVNRAFTAPRVADLEPVVQRLTTSLLGDMADEVRPDVATGFAEPLPIRVIAAMLGVPAERHEWVASTSARLGPIFDIVDTPTAASIDAVIDELTGYYIELAAERRRDPRDDLMSALVHAQDHGQALSDVELVAMVALLMFAGHVTTTGAIGNSLIALAANPDQRAMIRTAPDLWTNAVAELLRYDTPLQTIPRAAARDAQVAGARIAAGDNLTIMVGAANRDPDRWDSPASLRLDRDDPSPISFGRGAHHCLGAALARLELRVALPALLAHLGDYAIDPERVVWRESISLRGPVRLPIERADT